MLLLAAFSAFAEEVPTTRRPGAYRPVVTERLVAGAIVALRSDHDRALGRLYPAVTGGGQVDRAAHERDLHLRPAALISLCGAPSS